MAVLSGWAWSAPSIQVLDSDERSSCRARSATKETPMQRRDINAADAPAPAGQMYRRGTKRVGVQNLQARLRAAGTI